MSLKSENKERKYQDIREDYKKMTAIKKHNVRMYTTAYVISQLAVKYYLTERQIENIVWSK